MNQSTFSLPRSYEDNCSISFIDKISKGRRELEHILRLETVDAGLATSKVSLPPLASYDSSDTTGRTSLKLAPRKRKRPEEETEDKLGRALNLPVRLYEPPQ